MLVNYVVGKEWVSMVNAGNWPLGKLGIKVSVGMEKRLGESLQAGNNLSSYLSLSIHHLNHKLLHECYANKI